MMKEVMIYLNLNVEEKNFVYKSFKIIKPLNEMI
mgnify:CR=1 FL=1